MLWSGLAEAACRQALALGLDVSGSVDAREYRLQLDGLADALLTPEVVAAFLEMPEAPAMLAVFEWSGPDDQRLVQDWVAVADAEALARVSQHLRGVARAPMDPSTAIGAAKRFGAGLLGDQAGCWRRVLDLSGDGESNTGPLPRAIRPVRVNINGLVVAPEGDPEALADYYGAYVVQGPEAFVERSAGFEDFERAMIRKLVRELQVLAVAVR